MTSEQKQLMEELEHYKITSQEDLENWIQNYCEYLVAEGIAGEKSNGKYYIKTEEQIKKELEEII
jgi:hypothetical protein